MGKCKCTIRNAVSCISSGIILLGGSAVCALIEYVSKGPLFQDPSIKGLVLVFTSVSFLSTAFMGFLGVTQNGVPWVTNLQISVECITLIATITAFLALKDTVYLPGLEDCRPGTANVTVCTCSKRADMDLPKNISRIDCDTLYQSRDMAYALIYLYVIIWIMCILELLIALKRACEYSTINETSELEDALTAETFYNIPYPEVIHKKEKKSKTEEEVQRDSIFTLINS